MSHRNGNSNGLGSKPSRLNSEWSNGGRGEGGRSGRDSSAGRSGGRYSPHTAGYSNGNARDRSRERTPPREMNTNNQAPVRNFRSDPNKTIFVGRLHWDTTEAKLRKHFQRFGEIRSLYLIRDILTGESRRYAFIEYEHSSEVDSALAAGINMEIDGKVVLVDRECGRTVEGWKPRRFGGGSSRERAYGQQQRYGRRYSVERREDRRRSPYNNGRGVERSSGASYRSRHERSPLDGHAHGGGHRYEPSDSRRGERSGGYDDGYRSRMHGYTNGRPSSPGYDRGRRMDRR